MADSINILGLPHLAILQAATAFAVASALKRNHAISLPPTPERRRDPL
jgi:hypothetical protein